VPAAGDARLAISVRNRNTALGSVLRRKNHWQREPCQRDGVQSGEQTVRVIGNAVAVRSSKSVMRGNGPRPGSFLESFMNQIFDAVGGHRTVGLREQAHLRSGA